MSAVDKSLFPMPTGLSSMAEGMEPLEISIENPDSVDINAGSLSIHMEPKKTEDFNKNLAEDMDDGELQHIANELLADYEDDCNARREWIDVYVKGLKLLGLKYEKRTEPWSGACGVFHPMMMEAAVKFQSEMISESFPAAGPVRTVIIGKETQEKKDAAMRVQEDMNYELTQRMQEYRPEHERMLLSLALAGNAFKKIYWDMALGRQTAPYIPPEDVIVPYGAVNLEFAERITHRMRKTKNELRRLQVAGFYRDVELGEPVQIIDEVEKQVSTESGIKAVVDSRFQLLEMHVNLTLDGDEDKDNKGKLTGIEIPYVVTVEKGTRTILAIRRNWLEDDKLKQRRQHFVHYGYIPGPGFYYYGLIHLIGGHTEAATALMRQLIDAGTLSNLPGGLKTKGLRIKGDDTPIAPGEFRDIDLPSGTMRDNIMILPYKEPSLVLMQLMDKVVQDGKEFAASGDLNVSDMSAQAPVGTTLAILERVMKVMSAVQARIHYTMKQEFKLLAAIIRDNTPEEYDYEPEVGDAGAKRADYDMVDVLPVSDPNASTMAQRIIQYQAVLQLAQGYPQIYDMPYLHRQMIEVMGIKNAQKIVPMVDDMKPVDPVSENMAIMNGKPVKAFMYQDHQAHLAVHMAALQDPKLQALIGQNPQAQTIMGEGAAHLMEHLAFEYRIQLQNKLGALLPAPPNPENDTGYLDPQTEVQVSQLAAIAAQQLLQQHQAEAQQAQIQQQQQDPIIQMQQQELQLKEREVALKEKMAQPEIQSMQVKAQADQQIASANVQIKQMEAQMKQMDTQLKQVEAQLKQQQLELARQEQERKNRKDAADMAARADEIALKQKDQEHRHEIEGAKLGIDVSMHKAEQELAGAQLGAQIGKDHMTTQLDAHKHRQTLSLESSKHKQTLAHEKSQSAAERAHQAKLAKQQAENPPAKGTE